MEEDLRRTEKTVLIVDDEPAIVDVIYHNLIREGYNVISANDGITEIGRASCRERV